VQGHNPYAAVNASGMGYPLFYPMPAILVLAPLGALPLAAARAMFAALGTLLLSVAAFRYGRGLPAALLSASFLSALMQGQWSPLLTPGAVLPWASMLWIVKPSIGLALAVGYLDRRAAWGACGLLAASFMVQPGWVVDWLEALRSTNHVILALQPGGFVLLGALVRWREPEGRLLTAFACVPQTPALYETLPLFLLPASRWGGYLLAALSLIATYVMRTALPLVAGAPIEVNLARRWPVMFWFMYLPALVIVLWPWLRRHLPGTLKDPRSRRRVGGEH
jgi:hypothetical protein